MSKRLKVIMRTVHVLVRITLTKHVMFKTSIDAYRVLGCEADYKI